MTENNDNLSPADKLLLEALRMPLQDDSDDLPDEPADGDTWVVFIPKRPARPPESPAASDE